MPEESGDLEIKCVRCGAAATFGACASSNPADTQESIVYRVIEQLGWRKTFAGWQCPNHRP